jgi:trehalose 6-phosphate synthase/phosphatase
VAGGAAAPGRAAALGTWERRLGCVPVDLAASIVEGYYRRYASGALWPALHGMTSRVEVPDGSWRAYVEANRQFARVTAARTARGDLIWVHDYHLMLLPLMLRRARPAARIGVFLHTPFASLDAFRSIPQRQQLIRGLLGADSLVFQTARDLASFRAALGETGSLRATDEGVIAHGRHVRLDAFGAGIDAAAVLGRQESSVSIRNAIRRLRRESAERRLLLAVDRLDYTKGILARLRAFRALRAAFPRFRERVQLVQVAAPTRETVAGYEQLARDTWALARSINDEFGTRLWKPVDLLHRCLTPEELAPLYGAADVAWVAPLRDGMNLVAKEYVASQASRAGVLVLSRFAGAAETLREALIVNPYDEEGSARTLARALSLPRRARQIRMGRLSRRVFEEDAEWWRERCLESLDSAVRGRHPRGFSTGSARPAA